MKQLKKTAMAMAVAQLAFVGANVARVQPAQAAPADNASSEVQPQVVVVSGQRAALASAQKIKQDSDEVVDSIVAEDIGKLPDRSVTEVLQRVAGVAIDRSMQGDPTRFSVEGSGVVVRGLPYVRSSLNGRDAISANGGRTLSFEDVPPELMAGVDVYKNPSAEQVEGGISGLVNLRTAMPFDFKGFKGAVSTQTTHASLKKGKASPSGSLLLSNRWKTAFGDIGVLVDTAYSESATRTDSLNVAAYYPRNDIEPGKTLWVPKGLAWRSAEFERTRRGNYVALQWRPNADITTGLSYFKSRYSNDWSDAYLSFQDAYPYDIKVSNGVYGPNGNLLKGAISDSAHDGISFNGERRVATVNNATADLSWNLQWRVASDWRMTADVQRIRSSANRFDSTVATGIQMPKQQFDLTGKFPQVQFDAADVANLADRNKYYWASTMEHLDKSSARSNALRVDLQHDLDSSIWRDIRFGVRFTDRDSVNQNTNPNYNWSGITQNWMLGWNIPHVAYIGDPRFNNGTTLNPFSNFFNGKISVPAVVLPDDSLARGYPDSYDALHKYHDILCAEQKAAQGWGSCDVWKAASYGNDPASINRQAEKTKSFYLQARFGSEALAYPIDGNIGVRYVRTNNRAGGYTVFTPSLPTLAPETKVIGPTIPNIAPFQSEQQYEHAYSNVLPSLNVRLKARSDLQFRLALAKAISRPDFSQLQGYTSLSEGITAVSDTATKTLTIDRINLTGSALGNPMLRPVKANQLDLTAEWYFSQSNSVTMALFYKDLKDIIVNQVQTLTLKDVNGKPFDFTVTSPVNGATAKVKGLELAYQQYYDNVPAWLKGIGMQTSYTLVDSHRNLTNAVYAPYCSNTDPANLNIKLNGCDTNGQSFGSQPMQGVSRHTFNLALMFDRGPLSARVAYNWRSKSYLGQYFAGLPSGNDGLDTNPASPGLGTHTLQWGLPGWTNAYGQVDASVFYKVTERFSIGLEGQNLTNATFRQSSSQHFGEIGSSWSVTGPRYTAQARYSF